MLSIAQRWGVQLNKPLLVFMAVTFLSGVGTALFVPTLSLFLSGEVGASPLAVGCFYTCNAVAGIVLSQSLARYSDRKGSRKTLIQFCLFFGILACGVFALSRNYWVLISLGIGLLSIGATASPQLFALAREHSDGRGERSVMFTSLLRAQFSLAWVLGPPLAFWISNQLGFTWLFVLGAAVYLCSGILVRWGLPVVALPPAVQPGEQQGFGNNADVRWLFLASTLMWTCNSMYLINMPLYVSRELQLPQGVAGWMMGCAAGLEIPIMLAAGFLSSRWGKKPMLLLAALAGCCFYIGMSSFSSPQALLMLQVANALFIGIVAGLGMIYFQDLMPGQMGQATTLFTNSIRTGAILAGLLAGLVAEYWSYFGVFILAIALSALAMILLCRVRAVR